MYRVFILTDREADPDAFPWAVDAEGISYDAGTELKLERSRNGDRGTRPDAVLLDLDNLSVESARILASRCREFGLPVVAVVSGDQLTKYDPSMKLDDFILHSEDASNSARKSCRYDLTRPSLGSVARRTRT